MRFVEEVVVRDCGFGVGDLGFGVGIWGLWVGIWGLWVGREGLEDHPLDWSGGELGELLWFGELTEVFWNLDYWIWIFGLGIGVL